MSSYVDLSTLHVPTPASEPPASWGAQIRENLEFLHDNRRVICTSSTRPGTPFEGLEIYETDTNKVLVYDGSAWVTTAYLGQFDSYTPTITQGATVSKTVVQSNYTKIGRRVTGTLLLNLTSSGTANNIITVTLPHTARYGAYQVTGTGYLYYAAGGTRVPFYVMFNSTTTMQFSQTADTVGPLLGQTGSSFAAAVVSGDAITVDYTFESAS